MIFLGGGEVTPNFFHISSSWVKIRLHAENHLPRLPGSALKVYVVGGVGGVGGLVPVHYVDTPTSS